MALPQSIGDLARWLGYTDLDDFLISCYYCGLFLTTADKILFDNAKLKLMWYEGGYYSVCYSCTRSNARLEFMSKYSGVYSVADIQTQYDCSLLELSVRCLSCLRELNRQEKRDVVLTCPDLFRIGDSIRTLCVVCRVGLQ